MASLNSEAVERARQEAVQSLSTEFRDDFLGLVRRLVHGPVFQWLLIDAPHETSRRQVMAALDRVVRRAGLRVSRLPLGRQVADVAQLEERLIRAAQRAEVVHVVGDRGWFDAARWDRFNVRRERIAERARARLLFWLDAEAIELASSGAPDLWAWRGGVYAFVPSRDPALHVPHSSVADRPRSSTGDRTDHRYQRIAEIKAWLAANPDAPDELLVAPMDELGRLYYDLAHYDDALAHWRNVELPFHERRGAEWEAAVTKGQIADILQVRGQLDEALRIRREEQLPIFKRLGNERSIAVTMGKIADILRARGQLDEALRIRREEELPVYERLGNVHEKAITMGQIADILQTRGQLDEALRIRREEELPVYERLGDVRSKAITMSKISSILHARGQSDEALRTLREEALPAFERIGDIRAKAVAMGRIADILQVRGQLDEALRIRQEEQLPVYRRLNDARETAVTLWKIGRQLLASGRAIVEGQALLREAHESLAAMGLPEAQLLAEEMNRLGLKP